MPAFTKRSRVEPGLLLELGVAVATLGMALVVIGVIAGALLYPGLLLLIAGLLLTGVAGILYTTVRADAGAA
ncbi:MAG: hypothetical protein ACREMA_02410 [Longimicrobiales bacterium]